ncbi:hypothetical protein B7P43_G10769 [Cryptotermes secundus]|uniref:Uncharacterized protein n=1 Tax=Cryptotermes secundus TaxID=105785 RepID=A0A2J7QKT1_9NEOP|nr:hypothetical protein B7P43_G10769 [Cryptotermes secundus]
MSAARKHILHRRSLLGNGSVKTFPRKRLAYKNGVSESRPDELKGRQLRQPSQFSTGVCEKKSQLEGSHHSERT